VQTERQDTFLRSETKKRGNAKGKKKLRKKELVNSGKRGESEETQTGAKSGGGRDTRKKTTLGGSRLEGNGYT